MFDHHTHFATFLVHQFAVVIAQIQFVHQSKFGGDGQKSAVDFADPYWKNCASILHVQQMLFPGNDVNKLKILYNNKWNL